MKLTALPIIAACLAPLPALAFDPADMTEAERDAFGAAVRDYLLSNPEVLEETIAVLEEKQAEAQAELDRQAVAENRAAIFEDDHSYVGGNPDGDVVMVEFLDYRCSFCRRAHPEVADLLEMDGEIKLIVKEFPVLGPESVEASRFAIATLQVAGGEAYQTMSDALMTHRGEFDRPSMAAIARTAGIDPDPILAAMDGEDVTDAIRENYALSDKLGLTGTPSFVIGETMLRGYAPISTMLEIVLDERAG